MPRRAEHEGQRARADRSVDSGNQPLGCRLLVTGRAVDLAGEKQTRDALRLQRRVSSVGWMKSYSTAYPGRSITASSRPGSA